MIESKQNPRVKYWKKLHKKKYREEEQCFLVEGWHLVEEAIHSDWQIQELIISNQVDYPSEWESEKIQLVSENVLDEIAQTEASQGVIAVVQQHEIEHNQDFNRLLLIDQVQDPGNVGTIIRSALAFGVDVVVLGKGTVDLFNDKVIRSTQGAFFHLPVVRADLNDWIHHCQAKNIKIYGTALDQSAQALPNVTPLEKFAVIVGNEGDGVQPKVLEQVDETLYIPIAKASESLNVGIATSIVLYHFSFN
ncbi:TrmH family RNA methyltransferase [Alkalibacillus aidingensis]|uniref:TrmH family RNA methyltransferase n=1 Tax=Alkalibacillus aidingensis TaxID=2747607 RepID=UPI001660F9D2|nr:RNA methyltransferase [Alkalibacillus aidingensis]